MWELRRLSVFGSDYEDGRPVHFGGMDFECFGDLLMQLPPSASKQAFMRRVMHQRVLEGIASSRSPRCASRSAAARPR